jgi:hypothetical protein
VGRTHVASHLAKYNPGCRNIFRDFISAKKSRRNTILALDADTAKANRYAADNNRRPCPTPIDGFCNIQLRTFFDLAHIDKLCIS